MVQRVVTSYSLKPGRQRASSVREVVATLVYPAAEGVRGEGSEARRERRREHPKEAKHDRHRPEPDGRQPDAVKGHVIVG